MSAVSLRGFYFGRVLEENEVERKSKTRKAKLLAAETEALTALGSQQGGP